MVVRACLTPSGPLDRHDEGGSDGARDDRHDRREEVLERMPVEREDAVARAEPRRLRGGAARDGPDADPRSLGLALDAGAEPGHTTGAPARMRASASRTSSRAIA
jgi:hypothetical protein